MNEAKHSANLRVIMYRNLVIHQAPSYALAGLFLSMLVTFVASDLDAVRQETLPRYEDDCRAVDMRSCAGHATSNIRVFRGF
jgi:hypothetical protein